MFGTLPYRQNSGNADEANGATQVHLPFCANENSPPTARSASSVLSLEFVLLTSESPHSHRITPLTRKRGPVRFPRPCLFLPLFSLERDRKRKRKNCWHLVEGDKAHRLVWGTQSRLRLRPSSLARSTSHIRSRRGSPGPLLMRRSYLNMQHIPSTSNIAHPQASRVILPVPTDEYGHVSNKRLLLKRSYNSAFTDVQDSKLTVANVQQSLQTVCLVLQYYHQQLQILAAGQNALVQAQAQNQAQTTTPLAVPQSPMARTAPRPPQPECPVPLRPMSLASSCTNLNPAPFINWPWNLPMGISSPPVQVPVPETPTSSAALPTTIPTNSTTTSNQKTEGAVPEMKWSSPSSVDSIGQKTDSTAVTETPTIDVLGMDGSESTSSASTMAMVTSPEQPQQTVYTSTAQETANYFLQQTELGRSYSFEKNGSIQRVGIIPTEKKRKPVSDDYVKLIRQQDLSEARIAKIQIPVIQALRIDPDFKPNSEQQVIQTVIQNRKYEENNHRDSMILLCKKLAERRVFGAKLMAQTTVAGLNHSNYSNLPEEGIIYIQHVCKKVLREKFPNEEEFWDAFREATKKLAARCRRVRHAKKNKNKDHDAPKPPSSELATTLRSLNMANLTENRSLIGNDIDMSSAAEALQSLSRTSDMNPLQAFSLSNHLNGILNTPPSTWSSVLTAATQPLIKAPKLEQAENEEIYEEKLSL